MDDMINITNILYILIITIIVKFFYNIYLFNKLINVYEKTNNCKIIIIRDICVNTIYKKIYKYFIEIFVNSVISIDDDESIRKIFSLNKEKNFHIIIETYGGMIENNDKILNIINRCKTQINTYIINYAMSAGSMITLASDNIYMDYYSIIGPTDPQISYENTMVSFNSIRRLVNLKKLCNLDDRTIINYYENKSIYDMNYQQITKFIQKHIKKGTPKYKIKSLIDKIANGDIPHHIPFDLSELSILNIKTPIPLDIKIIHNNIDFYYWYILS